MTAQIDKRWFLQQSALGTVVGVTSFVAHSTVSCIYDVSKAARFTIGSALQVGCWSATKIYSFVPTWITASPFVETVKKSIPSFSNPFPALPNLHILKNLNHFTKFSFKLALVSFVVFVILDIRSNVSFILSALESFEGYLIKQSFLPVKVKAAPSTEAQEEEFPCMW